MHVLHRSLLGAVCAVAAASSSSACAAPVADEGSPPPANATATTKTAIVTSGKIRRWPEATAHLLVRFEANGPRVELGRPDPSGLDAFWSIASTSDGGSGYFYADVFRARGETRVAHATSRHVSEIRDAAALDWSTQSVGPVPVGGIVVLEHTASARTRRYLALVLDAIEPTDPRTAGAGPYAYADVTWYLASEGSADFSPAR